jgi:integrase
MEQSESAASSTFVPWNRGRLIGPKPPLKPSHIWEIRMRLKLARKVRDLALFDLAIDSKLRGCDLVKLRSDDVVLNGAVKTRSTVQQRKTRRPVHFEITEQARASLAQWLERRGLDQGFLFPSRVDHSRPLSTRQYSRLVRRWVDLIGLDPSAYGAHSLRRTKASLIYKKTGNLRAVQLLLGHTKIESTVRYLGIEVDDALAISEQTEI